MHILKKDTYTLLKPKNSNVADFLLKLEEKRSEFENQHLIIDFSEEINTNLHEILLFLNLSRTHKNNGTSFVIVCKGVEIDSIPEELAVVPTIEEALDVLEMDAIERDLGF
jgi:hypothetical protein